MPHWGVRVLAWLKMVKEIGEAYGKAGEAARYKLDVALSGKPLPGYKVGPGAVYAIYQDLCHAQENEASRAT